MRILSYHVYNSSAGGLWLSDDEKTWTNRFSEAASFNDCDLAVDIGEREKPSSDDTIYVFACMESR
jgi:hypothetical protein